MKVGPGGVDSPLEPLVFNNGWAATADYIDGHKTTMLRFASGVFSHLRRAEKGSVAVRRLHPLPQ